MNEKPEILMPVDTLMRRAAIVAGIGLLIMAILAPIANFSIIPSLVVHGDAKTTANNIMSSIPLFRMGICFLLIVSILDIIVAWALYIVLRPVNKELSVLAACLRIVYAAIFAISINNLLNILLYLKGAEYLKAIELSQLYAHIMVSLDSFQSGWNIGMTIFGLHLSVLGYLIYKSGYFPKFLGVLVIISSIGYLTDSFGKIVFSNYKLTLSMFTFIGEVLLIFWLFGKGIKGFSKKAVRGKGIT